MNDPDIRMDGGSSSEPDYPELDAMDYRSEYSMMNDAHGSSNVRPSLEWLQHCPLRPPEEPKAQRGYLALAAGIQVVKSFCRLLFGSFGRVIRFGVHMPMGKCFDAFLYTLEVPLDYLCGFG